jgi:hypothetical protein
MSDNEGNTPSDDAESPTDQLIKKTQRLTLLDKGPQDKANRGLDAAVRFHGKSTNFNLVMATREMKIRYLMESMGAAVEAITKEVERSRANGRQGGLHRPEYWRAPEVSIYSCPRQ